MSAGQFSRLKIASASGCSKGKLFSYKTPNCFWLSLIQKQRLLHKNVNQGVNHLLKCLNIKDQFTTEASSWGSSCESFRKLNILGNIKIFTTEILDFAVSFIVHCLQIYLQVTKPLNTFQCFLKLTFWPLKCATYLICESTKSSRNKCEENKVKSGNNDRTNANNMQVWGLMMWKWFLWGCCQNCSKICTIGKDMSSHVLMRRFTRIIMGSF